MGKTLFDSAKKYFLIKDIEGLFIEDLQCKRYLNKQRETISCDEFLKILLKKKYISKSIYNRICSYYNEKGNLETIKENRLIELADTILENTGQVNETCENETYEIMDKDYIDYDSISIDGIEYYIHRKNMNLVDPIDFGDMGYWDKEQGREVFKDKGCREKHYQRVPWK
tara:strand:+ start:822 stop:1331 length:510 start_codon:yes stop_codon:yes gene_type:complete